MAIKIIIIFGVAISNSNMKIIRVIRNCVYHYPNQNLMFNLCEIEGK